MKFAFKIVSGTMLIILVMFSLSGILFIHNHFQQVFRSKVIKFWINSKTTKLRVFTKVGY